MKKLLTGIIAALLLAFPVSAADFVPVTVRLNGEAVPLDAGLVETTTYVELDRISEILGRVTGVDAEISADDGDIYVSSRGRCLGGSENFTENGKTYVPIRSVTTIFGSELVWHDDENGYSIDLTAAENPGISPGGEFYIQDEVDWLARIIYAEAGAEPFAGKVLVGNVVLNRMRSDEFPDTIYDVIFDTKFGVQFSPVANGSIWNTPDADCVAAAKICLEGYSLSTEAIYFLNPDIATNFWIPNNRPYLFRVGGHEFYS